MDWERRDFWSAIAELPFCLLTTSTGSALRARPMAPRVDAERREIHFLTRLSSHKSHEIEADAHVNLAFLALEGNAIISVSGGASIVQDQALIDKMWDEQARRWFPEGRAGGDVALVKVVPQSAERWDRGADGHSTYAWISFTPV